MEMLPENYKRSKVSMPRMDVQGFWAIVDSGFHKQYMHNVLHLNHGNGYFSDVSQMAGISKTEWSWATLASDFDNDGDRDIFVANGYRRDLFDGDLQQKQETWIRANMNKYKSADEMFDKGFKEFLQIYDPIKVRNYLFRNNGDLKFDNVSEAWGFKDSTFSNGAAVADLAGPIMPFIRPIRPGEFLLRLLQSCLVIRQRVRQRLPFLPLNERFHIADAILRKFRRNLHSFFQIEARIRSAISQPLRCRRLQEAQAPLSLESRPRSSRWSVIQPPSDPSRPPSSSLHG